MAQMAQSFSGRPGPGVRSLKIGSVRAGILTENKTKIPNLRRKFGIRCVLDVGTVGQAGQGY